MLKLLKKRPVSVPGWGEMRVRRYIVRIDIHEPGLVGTHGWQVRYQGKTKFFSDSKAGKLRSPRTSIKDAEAHLASVYTGEASRIRMREHRDKANPLGAPGIRLVRRVKPGRNVAEIFYRVDSPSAGGPPRSVYVGTDNTVTERKSKAALRKAKALRRVLVDEHLAKIPRVS